MHTGGATSTGPGSCHHRGVPQPHRADGGGRRYPAAPSRPRHPSGATSRDVWGRIPRTAGARTSSVRWRDRDNPRRCPSRPPSTLVTMRPTWLPTKRSSPNARRTTPASPASTRRSSTTSHTWPACNMAPQRLWRSGLTPSSASPGPPSPARPSDDQGPGPHPSPPLRPSGRGEVGGSARRPACNHAGAPHCRRRVRGPPGPLQGRGRTGPLHQVHPGRLRQPRTSGGEWRAPHNRPCGRPRRSGCHLGPSCHQTPPRPPPACGQRGIRHRGRRPGRATWGASAQATRRGTHRRRSTT